jgi:predicted transcriptional regulator
MFPSTIKIYVNGSEVSEQTLPDDPADHRGVLSWHAQAQDRKLSEAGSYGYLIKVPLYATTRERVSQEGTLIIRLETVGEGGLEIYVKNFGRYPLDPSLVVKL